MSEFIVAITGGVASGKSTVDALFRSRGVVVADADIAARDAVAVGSAGLAEVVAVFGEGVLGVDGELDRPAMRRRVFADANARRRLEAIIHPLVGQAQMDFLHNAEKKGAAIVILDVPLLFETRGEARVDAVVVVSAPADVQRARVLARPGMTEERFDQILKRQMADAAKRAQAHYIIDTHLGLDHARERVAYVLEDLKRREAKIWKARKDAVRQS